MINYPVYDESTNEFLGVLRAEDEIDLSCCFDLRINIKEIKSPFRGTLVLTQIFKLKTRTTLFFPTLLTIDLDRHDGDEQQNIREYLAVDLPGQDPAPNEDTSNAIDELESGKGKRFATFGEMLEDVLIKSAYSEPGKPLYASQEISPEQQKFEEIKNLATRFLLNQTERAISHCSGDNISTYVVCSDFVHSCWTLAECFYGLADRKSKEGK